MREQWLPYATLKDQPCENLLTVARGRRRTCRLARRVFWASFRTPASLLLLLPIFLSVASVRAGELVPAGSEVGALRPGQSLHLLSALELGSFVKPDGWHMEHFAVEKADAPAKLGRDALTFRGTSAEAAKGDFDIGGPLPGEALAVGWWFHLTEGANVRELGLQFYDNEGESLIYLVPANWTGWKWVETPLTAAALKQAYPQRDKNGVPDMPIKGVHIVWWTKGPGTSAVTVDGAVARVRLPEADRAGGRPGRVAPWLDRASPATSGSADRSSSRTRATNPPR